MYLLNVTHMLKATRNSLSGLHIAWRNEQAFRHEVFVFVCLSFVLWWTAQPWLEVVFVLGGWLLVMAFELLNSAIEKTCDLISSDYEPLIKSAKDMASAAIFLAMVLNILIWLFVF